MLDATLRLSCIGSSALAQCTLFYRTSAKPLMSPCMLATMRSWVKKEKGSCHVAAGTSEPRGICKHSKREGGLMDENDMDTGRAEHAWHAVHRSTQQGRQQCGHALKPYYLKDNVAQPKSIFQCLCSSQPKGCQVMQLNRSGTSIPCPAIRFKDTITECQFYTPGFGPCIQALYTGPLTPMSLLSGTQRQPAHCPHHTRARGMVPSASRCTTTCACTSGIVIEVEAEGSRNMKQRCWPQNTAHHIFN